MIDLNRARSRLEGKDCVETETGLGFTIRGTWSLYLLQYMVFLVHLEIQP